MNDIDFPYVVLRNFEGLPESVTIGGHGDLDLLVYDIDHWMEIFPQAKRVYPHPRVQFTMPIGDTNVYMDIRYVGDDYYPEEFEKAILDSREWNAKGFWTPNALHFRLGLAYHIVHHKNCNTYQKYVGDCTVEDLLDSLKKSTIGYVEPKDPSVGRFYPYWKGCTSVVEKTQDGIKKKQVSYGRYDLTANEHRILSKATSCHFPKVFSLEDSVITIEDCGEALTVDNLPNNWKEQMVSIALALKADGIQHRDIKPDNFMVKGGVIKLIDFGWARMYDDPPDNPPSCLGYPYKPSYGFDDNYSMKVVIKQFEYKLEEKHNAICA
jgi:hypothetical protein